MPNITLTQAQFDALLARAGKPRAGKAKSKVKGVKTYFTRAEIAAGGGFPCSADEPCGRVFRTASRAATHGVDEGGHEPAAAAE